MEYIDIGVNLLNRQFRNDIQEVMRSAREDEIGIIITGTDNYANKNACGLIENFKEDTDGWMWSTCGFHPHNADEWMGLYKQAMIKLLDTKSCIKAIGEIGLDFDRNYSSKENQIKCFEEILDFAEGYDKPLFLHERGAVDTFCDILKKHERLCHRAVVHCFTGTKEAALKYLELGCSIGITGWVCDNKRNQDLLEALKEIPIERLMVETDAPYLTPKGLGLSSRNTPSNIVYVVKKLAEVKELPFKTVKNQVLKNTREFFNI